tara:strand:- start:2472 stop:4247 length:1776 start_codon:yes stop_codon:yes gene_type:complete
MKKILLSVLLLASTAAYSQELDEAYLASLPEDIRKDVLEGMNSREELDRKVYRRPSTMIIKNYCTSENNNNDQIDDLDCIVKSNRFGSKIFDSMQTSFMPINEPNFDSSYVLDFGDTLQIQLIGQKNYIEELALKRDGSINIPEIGKVFAAGLSLEEVSLLIKSKVKNAYIGIEAFVSLVNIRDIQVLITGNAFNPGIYTLNGNSNLLHALSMAGGIDEGGSYRQVDLIRDDKVINSIDLYDIFIYGKTGFGQRLRSGDSILIRPANHLVSVSGSVKRPGIFELKPDETFLDLFNYGNGFEASANKDTLRIERLDKENVKFIKITDVESLSTMKTMPGDRLNVRSYERKTVSIIGAINTPGEYTISKGETLSSLIQKAEGYKDDAYPFGGILINLRTEDINRIAVEKLYTSFIQKLITKGDSLFASEALPFILEELKKSPVSGRVSAEFDLDVIKASPSLDTSLSDGDRIIIPPKTQQVYIFGEVNKPGTTRYTSGQGVNQYLSAVGGTLVSGDRDNIFVIHPNGEINRISKARVSFLNNRSNDILVYPGSVIYVPRIASSADPTIIAAIWGPILSSFALTLTSLSVLINN